MDAATFKVKRLSRGHSQDNQDCMCKHENGEDGDEYESNPGCPEAGHSHEVSSLSFAADGEWVMSGSHDHTIRVWDTHAVAR